MRVRMINPAQDQGLDSNPAWLDLEDLAEVELSSEDNEYRIESALLREKGRGWRAAEPGKQVIRLLFALPQDVRRIRLEFLENSVQRTQEYVLRWSMDGGHTLREIVRQQWNFSPEGATRETEDYRVELARLNLLELIITPDVSGGGALASLAQLQLA